MQAILVRIGVDHSYGRWNAPIDPLTNEFVYVPIPEKQGIAFHPDCERPYELVLSDIVRFAEQRELDLHAHLRCPRALLDQVMHLDPDFGELTYGDDGARRGAGIRNLKEDDLLVFYAGLRPTHPCAHKLIYAMVGLYVIQEVVAQSDVPASRFHENAHTRKTKRGESDIVVRAKPVVSGRLTHAIPIGEYRDRSYRLCHDVLDAWGGVSAKGGYLQRSAVPPQLLDPVKFLKWFDNQNATLIAANNLQPTRHRVIFVMLRQPRRAADEKRDDPFWEFGSFGCTGCHRKNVMNPRKIDELEGVRIAFAQGGPAGFKLVHLTSPVSVVKHKDRCELRWPPAMPFRYDAAPLLIDNAGGSDFPLFRESLRGTNRDSNMEKMASRFRSRRKPLREDIGEHLITVYEHMRRHAEPSAIAASYEQAMPFPPPLVDHDRTVTYRTKQNELKAVILRCGSAHKRDGPASRC